MVDDLDGDAPGRRAVEGAGYVAVERCPGFLIDLGLQRRLERLVGVVRAQEIGVTDEETLLVIVGVDEPAGDALGAVAADLAGVRVENVHAVYLDLELLGMDAANFNRDDVDVRLAEDDEEVSLAGVLEVVRHVEVGVHARLEHRDAPEFIELRSVGVVAEGAGDKDIETGIGGLARRRDEVGARDRAELRANEHRSRDARSRSHRRPRRIGPRRKRIRPARALARRR